jgi:hypothetical protein
MLGAEQELLLLLIIDGPGFAASLVYSAFIPHVLAIGPVTRLGKAVPLDGQAWSPLTHATHTHTTHTRDQASLSAVQQLI